MIATADFDLLRHYAEKYPLLEMHLRGMSAAHRAIEVAEAMTVNFLKQRPNLAPCDIAAICKALSIRAKKESKELTDEHLNKFFSDDTSVIVHNWIQRNVDQVARERRAQHVVPTNSIRKKKIARTHTVFGSEKISTGLPTLLIGSPQDVIRATENVVNNLAKAGARTVVLSTTRGPDIFGRSRTTGPVVYIMAPWWDSFLTNIKAFRSLMGEAAKKLGGDLDVLVCEDLTRKVDKVGSCIGVVDSGARTVAGYRRALRVTRGRFMSIVSGLPRPGNIPFTDNELYEMSSLGPCYELSQEKGLLFGTDNTGKKHLII